jgi:hypothetical protein
VGNLPAVDSGKRLVSLEGRGQLLDPIRPLRKRIVRGENQQFTARVPGRDIPRSTVAEFTFWDLEHACSVSARDLYGVVLGARVDDYNFDLLNHTLPLDAS